MKLSFRTISALLTASIVAVVACSKYDDTGINERIDNLDSRITALEKWQSQINSQIQTLQSAIDALNKQDQITDVRKLDNDAGWEITFSKSGTITIYNGIDGTNGKNGSDGKNGNDGKDGTTPTIGVKLGADGNYYWTVNGEYLLDDSGNKISATAHISTPQIRINQETEKFEISYNNGVTWIEIGDAGNSSFGIFSNIVDDTSSVIFYLADGSSITIPKKVALALILNGSAFAVSEGMPTLISYSIVGADDNTVIDGFATNGYDFSITASSISEGIIVITPPSPLVEGKLFLIAFNEKETSAKVLSFEKGQLMVDESSISVPATGGNISFKVSTNMNYSISVDYSALTWVSVVDTKSLRTEEILLNISENDSEDSRTGIVNIVDGGGMTLQEITIIQAGKSTTPVEGGGCDDFSTMNGGAAGLGYSNYTSTNGWSLVNGMVVSSSQWAEVPVVAPSIGGRKSKVGVLTSPSIEGGCGKLSFSYGSQATLSKGLSYKIEVKNEAGTVLKEITITKEDAVQKQRFEFEEDINISGTLQLVFTNLCPAQKTTGSFDSVVIFNLSWTGYAE